MIRNVIFDLDGTLLDTSEGILESARYAAVALGFPELPYEKLLTFVGPPIQQSFIHHYGCSLETAQEAAEIFRDYYKTAALLKAVPYSGIYLLCERLQEARIRMSVATYKREDYALTLLSQFGFDRFCCPMHGADNNNVLKKEDIVRMCLEEMSAVCEETVLIGDTEHDAFGAQNAGISFLAVTYGFGFKTREDAMAYPTIGVADTPLEIAAILLSRRKP
ncbi:MAG: HAD hydrolase-like protein [Lachnospiraceae bacterium]|nr:HAD hydrolase-like protein [Lachnospiraceae bacterium]